MTIAARVAGKAGGREPLGRDARLLLELALGAFDEALIHLDEPAGQCPRAREGLAPALDQRHVERAPGAREHDGVDRDHWAGEIVREWHEGK